MNWIISREMQSKCFIHAMSVANGGDETFALNTWIIYILQKKSASNLRIRYTDTYDIFRDEITQ